MLDLKIVDEDQYDLVPVPLPGRLIVFAGPDGLMCRRNDGTITNYPAPAEGGGGGAALAGLVLESHADYSTIPSYPGGGQITLSWMAGDGIHPMSGRFVFRDQYQSVFDAESGALLFDPSAPVDPGSGGGD